MTSKKASTTHRTTAYSDTMMSTSLPGRYPKRPPLQDTIVLVLPHEHRYFPIAGRYLFREPWYRTLNINDEGETNISGVTSCILNMYLRWVLSESILGDDLSFALYGKEEKWANKYADLKDPLVQAKVPYLVTTSALVTESDDDTAHFSLSRRLLHAFFFGHNIKALHFQDAVMNEVVRNFKPDIAPPASLIKFVYTTSPAELKGFKKLLVDYSIWALCMTEPEQQTARLARYTGIDVPLPPFNEYPQQFQDDVNITLKEIAQRKAEVIQHYSHSKRRKDFVNGDRVIDFANLEVSLRDHDGGRDRCRYHQHGADELCFSLLVDDEPLL
ncbi:hypothetical protein BS50DRAFT_665311 [Corynespora cassiicola Philippines]|uniref:Uncharacterized protein n=1 Tax=Corynespora cassiicola Philippines TaxID=1448308 RepID=A0A2T2NR64_CORCC|nr:hypothetical protein BS50DRAFT_665311 [Corynespora cassiicola Philippines]